MVLYLKVVELIAPTRRFDYKLVMRHWDCTKYPGMYKTYLQNSYASNTHDLISFHLLGEILLNNFGSPPA